MKVLPYSNTNYSKNYNTTSFKGLWIFDQTPGVRKNEGGFDSRTNTHYYFPFIDESKESIEKAIQSHTGEAWQRPGGWDYPDNGDLLIDEAKVKATLPFKEADWVQYTKNKFLMAIKDRNYIEETLRRLNLKSYIK